MSGHLRSPQRFVLGGAIAYLLVCALEGRTAQASCGDWLSGHSMLAILFAEQHEPAAPHFSLPPAPCDGPACRRDASPPVPAVPVTISIDSQERLCLIGAAALNGAEWRRLPAYSDELAPPEIIRDRIDRPPRASALSD